MTDAPARTGGSLWRLAGAAGAALLALGVAVAATGGADWAVGPLRVRAHEPWRLLGAGVLLLGASAWLGGRRFTRALEQAWDARDRYASIAAAAAAVGAAAVGFAWGTGVAGGADAYGYVSQALLWLRGVPIEPQPLAAAVPWPQAEWSLSPLGYRPGIQPGMIVPTYAPGLPLTMALAAALGGPGAVFLVVPLLGAAAVWLTYLVGRQYADGTTGAAAAVLLATSPAFLYQVVQPMSDVPVTAWWLLSLWGAAAGRPLAAGGAAALAVLTRPNLVPAAAVVMIALLIHPRSNRPGSGPRLRAALLFAGPLLLAAAFLAWLNTGLYGSPLMSGYGSASELFSSANIVSNAVRYTRWLVETQTPLVFLGVAAPIAGVVSTRSMTPPITLRHAWVGLGFAAIVVACYLPYAAFEEWWYLRFLLPAIAVALVLSVAVPVRLTARLPAMLRAPLFVSGVGLLAAFYVSTAVRREAFDLRRFESRYIAAGAWASERLPADAVLLSVQQSGPLRLYGRRTTVRFDYIEPRGLDAAVRHLDSIGRPPYFVLEAWEEVQFRDRFAAHTALGLLDWPPVAEVGRPVRVRFYDPRDRARFLAGEPVATERDPLDAPPSR